MGRNIKDKAPLLTRQFVTLNELAHLIGVHLTKVTRYKPMAAHMVERWVYVEQERSHQQILIDQFDPKVVKIMAEIKAIKPRINKPKPKQKKK